MPESAPTFTLRPMLASFSPVTVLVHVSEYPQRRPGRSILSRISFAADRIKQSSTTVFEQPRQPLPSPPMEDFSVGFLLNHRPDTDVVVVVFLPNKATAHSPSLDRFTSTANGAGTTWPR